MPPAQLPLHQALRRRRIRHARPPRRADQRALHRPPSGRAPRPEVLASHAWAYGSCDLDDDDAVLSAGGTLPKKDRYYLLDRRRHPLARAGDGVMASAVWFPSPSPSTRARMPSPSSWSHVPAPPTVT